MKKRVNLKMPLIKVLGEGSVVTRDLVVNHPPWKWPGKYAQNWKRKIELIKLLF